MQYPHRSVSDPGPGGKTSSSASAPPGAGDVLERLLETVVRYKLVRSEASVSYWRVLQALHEGVWKAGLSPRRVLLTGSRYEGMPWEVCGDRDVMVTYSYYPKVLHQDPRDANADQMMRSGGDVDNSGSYLLFADDTQWKLIRKKREESFTQHQTPQASKPCEDKASDKNMPASKDNTIQDDTDTGNGAQSKCDKTLSAASSKYKIDGYLVATPVTSQPAYLKLRVCDRQYLHPAFAKVTNEDGYVSSKQFVEAVAKTTDTTHGPAATGLASKRHPQYGTIDIVHCFPCPVWPPCADDFLIRPRPYRWPSQALLCQVKAAGCHVVGVGHPDSAERELEWRWSFSLAERELIHHLSDTMRRTLFLLKVAKMAALPATLCCSYYIKTACLWVAETQPGVSSIVVQCKAVLEWLQKAYIKGRLPHYFVSGQNLVGQLSAGERGRVATGLQRARGSLGLTLLPRLVLEGHVADVIRILCVQLQVEPVSQGGDFRELAEAVEGQAQGLQLVEEAVERLSPPGPAHSQWRRSGMGLMAAADYTVLYHTAEVLQSQGRDTDLLISVPDSVLLPVLDTLPSLVKPGYSNMFRQGLHRYLGDSFLQLSYLPDIPAPLISSLLEKAVKQYTIGREMVHPDGWSDGGLGGSVLLAKLFYLSAKWTQLYGFLEKLQALLRNAKREMNSYSPVVVDLESSMCVVPWEADAQLHREVIQPCSMNIISFHPVMLGLYIVARCHIRLSRRQGVRRILEDMEGCVAEIWSDNLRRSSKDLIQIVKANISP